MILKRKTSLKIVLCFISVNWNNQEHKLVIFNTETSIILQEYFTFPLSTDGKVVEPSLSALGWGEEATIF